MTPAERAAVQAHLRRLFGNNRIAVMPPERKGGSVELTFHNGELSPNETPPEKYKPYAGPISTHGRVTRCEPPRLLSFTWGGETEESEVTFELTPRGKDVLLVLTHRRLADHAAMLSVSGGWHTHLAILQDRLNGTELRPFWATLSRADAEYEKRLAAT